MAEMSEILLSLALFECSQASPTRPADRNNV
jgi:hypothetical protein